MGSIKQNRANNILTSGKIDATDGLNNAIPASNIANASLTNVTSYPPSAGLAVTSVASDPPSPNEGQIWYNTTSGALKQYSLLANWSSGGNLNTARRDLVGGGTQTSAIAASGYTTFYSTASESYDGSTWTSTPAINADKYLAGGAGTSNTSAVIFGGETPASIIGQTELWNGSSWTEVNDMNQQRENLFGIGTTTSALGFGGYYTPATVTGATESWDGTNWTAVSALNTVRSGSAGAGATNTAAIAFSAGAPGIITELWNGSAWTEVNDLNTSRNSGAGAGTSTSALAIGGYTPSAGTTAVESWDGTSWTTSTSKTLGVYQSFGAGTSASALSAGGATTSNPAVTNNTEEWVQTLTTQTITAS